jgi:hypothetical protein
VRSSAIVCGFVKGYGERRLGQREVKGLLLVVSCLIRVPFVALTVVHGRLGWLLVLVIV